MTLTKPDDWKELSLLPSIYSQTGRNSGQAINGLLLRPQAI